VSLVRELAGIMERRTYRLGSFIFKQGENSTSMFVLASGSVRIVRQMHVSDRLAHMQRLVRPTGANAPKTSLQSVILCSTCGLDPMNYRHDEAPNLY
jgi:hypothetical protein